MKSSWETRKPYNGVTKSLAVALDVGTTFSGVSYAILEPGEVPKIHGVTRSVYLLFSIHREDFSINALNHSSTGFRDRSMLQEIPRYQR
jgi:hypothetical protein